ncbi:MAG: TolC family protein, partial [Muribaculaceae bacterium]|nr:TolC family protein [Muribaculaceae bacterium]
MNNQRLLTGIFVAAVFGCGQAHADRTPEQVMTLEQLFETAETNSVQLRPSFTAEEEARREISVARNGLLPDINASVSLSYIGDGFTTRRDFSDYEKAPIPHLGNMA